MQNIRHLSSLVEVLQLSISVWNTRRCYCWGNDSFSSRTYMFVYVSSGLMI